MEQKVKLLSPGRNKSFPASHSIFSLSFSTPTASPSSSLLPQTHRHNPQTHPRRDTRGTTHPLLGNYSLIPLTQQNSPSHLHPERAPFFPPAPCPPQLFHDELLPLIQHDSSGGLEMSSDSTSKKPTQNPSRGGRPSSAQRGVQGHIPCHYGCVRSSHLISQSAGVRAGGSTCVSRTPRIRVGSLPHSTASLQTPLTLELEFGGEEGEKREKQLWGVGGHLFHRTVRCSGPQEQRRVGWGERPQVGLTLRVTFSPQ